MLPSAPSEGELSKGLTYSEELLSFTGFSTFRFLILVVHSAHLNNRVHAQFRDATCMCRKVSRTGDSAVAEGRLVHLCLRGTQGSSVAALGSWPCPAMGFAVRCGQKASSFVVGGGGILIVNIHRSPPLEFLSFLIEESSNFSTAGTVIDKSLNFSILGACWTWNSHCFLCRVSQIPLFSVHS